MSGLRNEAKPIFRLIGSRALLLACSVALLSWGGLQPAWANNPLFAGIQAIEAQTGGDPQVQTIAFQSDLPFQYQMQVLNDNQVLLRLYNARLSRDLLSPKGTIQLKAGGIVQSATLKMPDRQQLFEENYQEIILNGPGLGARRIEVVGAQELPVAQPVAALIPKTPAQPDKAAPRRVAHQKPQVLFPRIDAPGQPDSVALAGVTEPSANPRIEIEPETSPDMARELPPLVDRSQPVAPAAMTPRGPQIAAIVDGPRTGVHRHGSQAATITMPQASPADMAPNPSSVASPSQPPATMPAADPSPPAEAAAPEPNYQMMMPLPRYQGGAPPIRAMTTNSQGRPVVLMPKNAPIVEVSVGNESGAYNTLLQADESDPSTVGHWMAKALRHFRAQAYPEARQAVEKALKLSPESADLHAALAEIQLKLAQPDAAARAYAEAAAADPNSYAKRYAQVLVLSGQRQKAIPVLEKLYRQDAQQAQVAYMLGSLYEELGRAQEALPYLKQAAHLYPASADIHYNLGLAYELASQPQEAAQHYRKATSLNPADYEASQGLERVQRESR